MNFFIKEAKKEIEQAKNSEEFFAVFKKMASSIDLDLSEYCDKLKERFKVETLSDKIIDSCPYCADKFKALKVEEVKKTMDNIKAEFKEKSFINEQLFDIIDKHIGDKLVKG